MLRFKLRREVRERIELGNSVSRLPFRAKISSAVNSLNPRGREPSTLSDKCNSFKDGRTVRECGKFARPVLHKSKI